YESCYDIKKAVCVDFRKIYVTKPAFSINISYLHHVFLLYVFFSLSRYLLLVNIAYDHPVLVQRGR
ncbi:MAG: hypothetical protein NTX36_03000, partial [Proteobacteria bacterium]|nr:hypothetical protein [Pseudomonadota bacterium]